MRIVVSAVACMPLLCLVRRNPVFAITHLARKPPSRSLTFLQPSQVSGEKRGSLPGIIALRGHSQVPHELPEFCIGDLAGGAAHLPKLPPHLTPQVIMGDL